MPPVLYKPKKILNINKHIDGGWFWNKYSAIPYIGCQYSCPFCYEIGTKYSKFKTVEEFGLNIKVKDNAVELMKKEIAKVDKDIIVVGDYQPIEKTYRLSRQLLEVCLDNEFPVLIITRSPLVLEDIDLLKKINKKSWVGVVFSISYQKSEGYREIFEPRAPLIEKRFEAMKEIASGGIQTGTAFMPIFPFISDDKENIEQVIINTKRSGGSFVIGGGLTLEDSQKERYLSLVNQYSVDLLNRYEQYFAADQESYKKYTSIVGGRIRYYCKKHGLRDRIPRYIVPGSLEINKRVAEALFLKVYESELFCESSYKIWAYRKAAWLIDEMKMDILEMYHKDGESGLISLDGIGRSTARFIGTILESIMNEGD